MKKKYIKIAIILISIFIISISFCNNTVLGVTQDQTKQQTEQQTQQGFFQTDEWKPYAMTDTEGEHIKNVGNSIIGFLQIIGSLVSVIALIIIGVKYMMGSVEEKAEYKKTMFPYIIGAIMVFGISNIMAIIVNLAKIFD